MSNDINPADLSISTFSTAKGGFAIPNNNGVRVFHKPTRVEVECSSERSQHANRAKAVEMLKEEIGKLSPLYVQMVGRGYRPSQFDKEVEELERNLREVGQRMKKAAQQASEAMIAFGEACQRLNDLKDKRDKSRLNCGQYEDD